MNPAVPGYYQQMPPQQVRDAIASRYRLLSEIGSGGMGTVWRAQDELLQRQVAIKEVALPPSVEAGEREGIRKRVLREARAAAALNHPNAVTVFDVIEEDGNAFIVMELISGRTLADLVADGGPLDDKRAARIARDVLGALDIAHSTGIVHRDVKPANVMITDDGLTKLADFGIASVKDDPKITATGLVLGSPSYMAPEQATHGESGPSADLWGLGATLYYAIEGAPPFEGNGPIPTLTAVVGDEHRPMQRQSALAGVVDALLAKDPVDRPSVVELRRMLDEGTAAPVTRPETKTTPLTETERPAPATATPAPSRDRRALWLVGLAALLAVGLFVALFVNQRSETTGERPSAAGERGDEVSSDDGAAVGGDEAAPVPQDWKTYEDPQIGYQISHPADWEVEVRDENNTFFHSPDGAYVQVAWTQPPTAETPEEAWEVFSEEFGSTHEDYVELGITPMTFKGMDAAELEFTYTDGGTSLHGLDLGFITPDDSTGMALYFQSHAEDWAASQETFEAIRAGFLPPS